ncbi:putative antirepressor [Alphaentomopoxvirus acuprea]|uniref:Putative antirepressor n=1 Tax=Alphaentomopoxvirus acuprea TaxID=62099 RepID=W6JPJ0_9POXV|nr:putative antirepressor [Anomala cuprea entomopoxvirus]YP_009001733.1 putative antirepressor [Anomala cuprea entomopoxvirus]BAO49364.1 putative antirepressor [Anomala cuprea entomopoxvirus]BAO49620.1 putative antirepressor [Anomala cuprea entomopoxvirus]
MENQLALLNINADNTRLDYKSFTSLAQEFIDNFNKIFEYNNKSIRILGNINEPWFNGKNILDILGYSESSFKKTLQKIDNNYKKTFKEVGDIRSPTPSNKHNDNKIIYINEAGLYYLIFNCKLESAVPFKNYILNELIPSIRKYAQQQYLDFINKQKNEIIEMKQLMIEMKNQNNTLISKNDELLLQNNQTLKKLEQLGISLEQSREENEELKDDIKNLSDDVKDISNELNETNNKLDDVLEDRNIKPADLKLQHKYMLLKSKQNENEFTFIRSQKKYIDKNILKWNTEFEIIINEKDNPNPTDLCTRLKEKIKNVNKLKYEQIKNEIKRNTNLTIVEKRNKINLLNKDDYIKINRNVFILNQCTELEFINLVKEFDNHKYDL